MLSGVAASAFASALQGANIPGGLVGEAIVAAVVGGTASVIGGGKFANGAYSGAAVAVFNHGIEHSATADKTFESKGAAFEQAKKDAGITNQDKLISQKSVPQTDRNGKPIRDAKGRQLMGREYIFQKANGQRVAIQHHPQGHPHHGNTTSHYNVRTVKPSGKVDRNSKVPGTRPHYNYSSQSGSSTPRSATGSGGSVGRGAIPVRTRRGAGGAAGSMLKSPWLFM